MAVFSAFVLLASATSTRYTCEPIGRAEVVPGAVLVVQRRLQVVRDDGRAPYFAASPAERYQAMMWRRDWNLGSDLGLAVVWPEAKSIEASLAGVPRWLFYLGRYQHQAGKTLLVKATGRSGAWQGRFRLTADHPAFPGPSPRRFVSVTVELHQADGTLEGLQTFALPDWTAFNRNLKSARMALLQDVERRSWECLHPPAALPPPIEQPR